MDFNILISNYSKLVYKICYDFLQNPTEAQDATQDTYLKMYNSYTRYKHLSENELKNILCKIAINRCKDILSIYKKKGTYSLEENITNIEDYAYNNDIYEKIFETERKENVVKIINELKAPYKDILLYYYIKEMSLDNLSIKLNIEKPTLKVYLYRAKLLLKNKISEKGGDNLL